MPVEKTRGGYRWGKTGKVYPTKKQAEKTRQSYNSLKEKKKEN